MHFFSISFDFGLSIIDDLSSGLSEWNGIIVTPQESVYDSGLYERKTGEEPEDEDVEEESVSTDKESEPVV